jgi:ABC-type lipoprotein export system ATPase subunit
LGRAGNDRGAPRGASVGYVLTTAGTLSGRVGANDAPGARGLDATTLLDRREAAVARAGARVPNLGAPLLTIVGAPLTISRPGDGSRSANGRLVSREGLADHIQKLQVAGGSGVWLPSETAGFAGVRAGGQVSLAFNDRRVTTRVAGIYKDLNRLPETPFWCSQSSLIYAAGLGREIPPPPILADRDTMAALDRQLRQDRLVFTWELPLPGSLTLSQSLQTAGRIGFLRSALGTGTGAVFRLLSSQALSANEPGLLAVRSELPFVAQRSRAIVAAVRGAIVPVSTAGLAVALLLVAAAGSYWVDRRRREVALLAAKGVGPLPIALKAGLEMVLPAAAGALAGWGLALLLVRAFGPSELLDASAPRGALARVGIALAGGVVLLGAVAALRVRAQTERGLGVRSGCLARIPFELGVLALAAVAFQRLHAHRPPVATGTTVASIDLLLLAFPLLFLTGMVGLGVRALGRVTRRLRTAGERWPHAVYLAARRLSSSSRLALLLGMLCGWDLPDQGRLVWSSGFGAAAGAGPAWSELAVVPQALGLVEELSVRENVSLPLRLASRPGRRAQRHAASGRADELLEAFGLGALADRSPRETSLGQQQRAAVARALVLRPRLMLADEPSAHQDSAWVHDVFSQLREVAQEGAACLVATHDPDALQFADRILALEDGRLAEVAA